MPLFLRSTHFRFNEELIKRNLRGPSFPAQNGGIQRSVNDVERRACGENRSPGQNQKEVVYGGVDYATGKILYTLAATKSGVNFLAFLITLVAAYAGRKVRLVL